MIGTPIVPRKIGPNFRLAVLIALVLIKKACMYGNDPYTYDIIQISTNDIPDMNDDMTDMYDDMTDMYEYHIHV